MKLTARSGGEWEEHDRITSYNVCYTKLLRNEELPFERPERIRRPRGLPKSLIRFVQAAIPIEALDVWPQASPEPREDSPIESRIPALILV